MRRTIIRELALLAVVLIGNPSWPARAAEIKLMSSVGVKGAIEAVLPDFARDSGDKVTAVFATAAILKARIDGGETFDVAILNPLQIDDLIRKGKAITRTDLARAGVGFGISAASSKPDIATDEQLKTHLLGVKSLAYGDPTQGGFGGAYFHKVTVALGIAEALSEKTRFTKPGEGAVLVANGGAELSVGLSSEIVPVAGVQFLPLKAEDPTSYINFAATVAIQARNADAANALLTFLQSNTVKDVFRSQGLTTR